MAQTVTLSLELAQTLNSFIQRCSVYLDSAVLLKQEEIKKLTLENTLNSLPEIIDARKSLLIAELAANLASAKSKKAAADVRFKRSGTETSKGLRRSLDPVKDDLKTGSSTLSTEDSSTPLSSPLTGRIKGLDRLEKIVPTEKK